MVAAERTDAPVFVAEDVSQETDNETIEQPPASIPIDTSVEAEDANSETVSVIIDDSSEGRRLPGLEIATLSPSAERVVIVKASNMPAVANSTPIKAPTLRSPAAPAVRKLDPSEMLIKRADPRTAKAISKRQTRTNQQPIEQSIQVTKPNWTPDEDKAIPFVDIGRTEDAARTVDDNPAIALTMPVVPTPSQPKSISKAVSSMLTRC